MVKSTSGSYDINKVEDAKWEIVDDSNGTIDTIRLLFFYHSSNTSRTYRITSVEPLTSITVYNLCVPNSATLEQAFHIRENILDSGAKYHIDYGFSYDPSIQNERSEP